VGKGQTGHDGSDWPFTEAAAEADRGITRDNLLAGVSKPWEGFLVRIGAGTRELNASDTSTRPFPDGYTSARAARRSALRCATPLHSSLFSEQFSPCIPLSSPSNSPC
jgi:hypothetical protein